ncbi:MAG: hypothetical protein JXM70_26785, partial [Pirellulales bacterium]|nr:hypothetical protein [Pirellulales bacterium]
TLQDLQVLIQSVSGGGLLALTLLGMLTLRVDNRAAIIAVGAGVLAVCGWLFLDSPLGHKYFSSIAKSLPDKFWMHVVVNVFVFILAYALSFLFRGGQKEELAELTVWSLRGECK